MVGSTIKVVVTAENGNTFSSDPTAKVDDGVYTFEIESAKATKVNEITVTFADAVDSENVTFTVTKGTESVPIEKVEATDWSLTEDEVTLKTSANMVKGTYTVTATDSVTKDTDSADFEVLDKQTVTKIVIKNTKAYTNASANAADAHLEAYAYYDVLDQYDQSIRSSASIQWAGSCEIKADKANGMLTLKKSGNDKKAWVYGEKIYITGVYTKTGAATSETLTVDTEQALNTIDVVGFLKKGDSKIIDDLPEDFKTETYYMLFHALDQNGCPLKADQIDREDVTFLSDSPLVVKEVTFGEADAANKTDNKVFTVEGTEYNGVFVNPGINVAKGGDVTVTAIANKTGKKTDYNFWVGEDAVVTTFTLDAPSGVVADGDSVEIPFTAAEADGTPITNFKQLAKQEIFNTLSFTTSEGTLRLAEKDNRTAKLTWTDDEKYTYVQRVNGELVSPWSYSVTTDDIDRPVSLTAIVVGGEPSNEMISVQDKRRPNSIAKVNLDDVYVEGADFDITLDSFQYYDQYGKLIDEDADATDYGDDNGFFAAAATPGVLKNTDFAGYAFGARIENTGNKIVWDDAANGDGYALTTSMTAETRKVNNANVANPKKAVIQFGESAGYETLTDITSAATGEGFKFEIAKFKDTDGATAEIDVTDPDDWDAVSPTKYKGLTVVDITQVKNFKISDLKTFYTGALDITGDKIIATDELTNLKDSTYEGLAVADGFSGGIQNDTNYRQEIVVKGTYAGSPVTVPHDYYTVSTTKGSLVDNVADAKDTFDKVGEIKLTDLYDKTTANGNAKLGQDEVVATIIAKYDPVSGYGAWDGDTLTPYISTTLGPDDASATFATARADYIKAAQLEEANAVLEAAGEETITKTQLTQLLTDETLDTRITTAEEELTNAQAAEAVAKKAATDAKTAVDTKQGEYDTALATLGEKNAAASTAKGDLSTEELEAAETIDVTADATNEDSEIEALTTIGGITDTTSVGKIQTYLKALIAVNTAKANLDTKKEALEGAQGDYTEAQSDYTMAQETTLAKQEALATLEAKKAAKTAAAGTATGAGSDWEALVADYYDKDTTKSKLVTNGENVYDTAKLAITYSDQAPYAADITGLLDSYTFNPELTVIDGSLNTVGGFYDATQKKGKGNLKIVDQYGVAYADGVLEFTISNAVEDKDGYAENNFKVSNNGTATPSIVGAEIGDTFDLTVSVKGETLKKTTKVTVGADMNASIVNSTNYYTNGDTANGTPALKDVLEAQRNAGLQ